MTSSTTTDQQQQDQKNSRNGSSSSMVISIKKNQQRDRDESNDRQQVKILIMIIVSSVILIGTLRYQSSLQTMIISSSQMNWGEVSLTASDTIRGVANSWTAAIVGGDDDNDNDNSTVTEGVTFTTNSSPPAATTTAPTSTNNNTIPAVVTDKATTSGMDVTVNNSTENSNSSSPTFHRYDNVAIATKLHGPHQHQLLDQSMCLLQAAYNRKVNYDIVVFYTEDLRPERMAVTERLVSPAKIVWAKDSKSLQEEIAALSPIRRKNFLQSCNVQSPENLTWFSECPSRIAYNWQAEFRSWQVWTHEALAPYKTMLWLDTDGFATREWLVDPIQTMIENDLNLLFMNFPQGRAKGQDVHERTFKGFNKTICALSIKDGHLSPQYGDMTDSCAGVPLVHGFFHITNLDFYRSPEVLRFEEIWIGDNYLQRKYDDQYGVTAPAAALSPEKAWDMYSHDIVLDVFHNGQLDGKGYKRAGGYRKYWHTVKKQMPEAIDRCERYIVAGNR